MSLTPSQMLPLGTTAADFNLPDTVSGNDYSLSELHNKEALFVMFICNHCPYVKHVNEQIVILANDYKDKISFVAISSNDVVKYPEDAPDKMKETAKALAYPFPYLFDESQDVARSYDAACTPDFYLFDKDLKCVYRGEIDSSRPGNDIPCDGAVIRDVFDKFLNGQEIPQEQRPSVGCNIKWKNA